MANKKQKKGREDKLSPKSELTKEGFESLLRKAITQKEEPPSQTIEENRFCIILVIVTVNVDVQIHLKIFGTNGVVYIVNASLYIAP